MHFHMELVLPPSEEDMEERIGRILEPFSEHEPDHHHSFWDWWVLGGRWSGQKLKLRAPEGAISAFYDELSRRNVTVSNVTCGKQTLRPASQQGMVDALWREMVPGCGNICPEFDHYTGSSLDVCRVGELPDGLSCGTFGVAFALGAEEGFRTLRHNEVWNGVSWQETDFCGDVKGAIEAHNAGISERASDEYREAACVRDDWLCVTIDYHS